MTGSQQAMLGERVLRIRELKGELARLKAENAALVARCAQLEAHLDLAIVAAADLRATKGLFHVVDGWNLVLGSEKAAASRRELEEKAGRLLAENPDDFVWIVYDGPRENSVLACDGRLRVTYTGGEGGQRADRFICDFLRAARLSGDVSRVRLATNDKRLAATASRLLR